MTNGCESNSQNAQPCADLVLRGGLVYALDEASSCAEAVATRAGVIIAVGTSQEISRRIGPKTRVIELDGRAVIPGINDSHLHGAWMGARWPHTLFGGDPSAPSPVTDPLVTNRSERRAAILRAGKLLSELGITSYTEPGIGPGEDDGETGCFHSDVLEAYRELAAEGTLAQRVTLLALYGVLDGPSNLETVRAGIEELTSQLKVRGAEEAGGAGGAGGAGRLTGSGADDPRWLNVTGVKIFGDLIPLSRQAWTEHGYDDGSTGTLLVEGDSIDDRAAALAAMLRAAHLAGLQIGVHATGDRTIGLVLDALAAAEGEPGAASVRELAHSVIHGDLASEAQVRRMAEMGVWLNSQSGIAALTEGWLAGLMGPQVAANAWAYRAAHEAGCLVLSSDSPVLDFDWRVGISHADARIVAQGGETDAEAAHLRLHGLLRSYTALPAAQDRASGWKGTVETGKVADLVVLARDPFEVGAAGLPGVAVDATVLDGRVVFEREGAPVPTQ